MPPTKPDTITDLDRLMEALAAFEQHGYATDQEEREVGIRCIFSASTPGWLVIGRDQSSAPADERLTTMRSAIVFSFFLTPGRAWSP